MKWQQGVMTDEDLEEQSSAKSDLRLAAWNVRGCTRCHEGWRRVSGGVVRCECWHFYVMAHNRVCNLFHDFYFSEEYTDVSELAAPRNTWVSLERIAKEKRNIDFGMPEATSGQRKDDVCTNENQD